MKAICQDVALGLNYLYLIQPDPIVHRDISSANVFLEELPCSKWRAKWTDYDSVNVVLQLRTTNPGSPAYASPEAPPSSSISQDGHLQLLEHVLEMVSSRLPNTRPASKLALSSLSRAASNSDQKMPQ